MSFYKFSTPAALTAWNEMDQQEAELIQQAATFAALFGAKPVFKNDLTCAYLYGVRFDGAAYGDPALWTKPTEQTGYAAWPRAKAPKGMGDEHKALAALWKEQKPLITVKRDSFLQSVGLDWGMLFLTGCTYFRRDDAIYFSTGAKPDPAAGGVEILGSEYQQAKTASSK
ncbi:hypothetical protein GKQ23_10770 [Erwinia sp. E602]|uniref:hypothetical protein n=1 Tax=Erwinia sp. E602 TaxID=2675378 RepID=UPI001BAA9ECB|nr:hypothetical protein [Erwinia sp. E602]QUG75438.1 hypothetical protein GKQ23_10770 [Erwinia sp. E602]